MQNEIYTPMEKVLVEGAKSLTFNEKMLLLIDYEMSQYMRELERLSAEGE